MPPKGKKKKIEEEVIDPSTLPEIETFLYTSIFSEGCPQQDELLQLVKTNDSVTQKGVTRDEVIEYAKERDIFVESEETPEITSDILTKAFAKKIYDLTIQERKAKKERIRVAEEEEAKHRAQMEKEGITEDAVQEKEPQLDPHPELYIFLEDFPITQEECSLLANVHDTSLNAVFYIKDGTKSASQLQTGEMEISLKASSRLEERHGSTKSSGLKRSKSTQRMDDMTRSAASAYKLPTFWQDDNLPERLTNLQAVVEASDIKSHLRDLHFEQLEFDPEAPAPAEDVTPLSLFKNLFETRLKGVGVNYLRYTTWLQEADIRPLMPIVKQIIQEEEVMTDGGNTARGTAENDIDPDVVEGKEVEGIPGEMTGSIQGEAEIKQEPTPRKPRVQYEAKGVDDYDDREWSLETYRKLLRTLDLTHTSISVILNALMRQIQMGGVSHSASIIGTATIAQEDLDRELDDVFDRIRHSTEISSERRVNGAAMSREASLSRNASVEVETPSYIFSDFADQILQKHLKKKLNHHEIDHLEKALFNSLTLPGFNRFLMPKVPTKSRELRNHERPEIHTFSETLTSFELDRFLWQTELENSLRTCEPKIPWDLSGHKYEEIHDRMTLIQVLYEALAHGPEICQVYNARDDNLMLCLYWKTMPGRVLRKKWRYDFKVKPDFSLWLDKFRASETAAGVQPLYDIDPFKAGELELKEKLMLPTDGSVIRTSGYKVGSQSFSTNKVVKEGASFGLKPTGNQNQGDFWIHFDDGVRYVFEMENLSNNPEGHGCCSTLSLTDGVLVKVLANGNIMQDNRWRVCPPKAQNGANCGNTEREEEYRILTGKGTIIRYLTNGRVKIHYANGNTSEKQLDDSWITTNTKGLRRQRFPSGIEIDVPAIPCAAETDPALLTKTNIREDKVTILVFPDGSRVVKHEEGTKIHTNASGTVFTIETEGFAPMKVFYGHSEDTGDDSLLRNLLIDRSADKRLVEIYCQNGTTASSYFEEQDNQSVNVTLISRGDGSLVKAQQDGEIVFISKVDTYRLNTDSQNPNEALAQLLAPVQNRKPGVYTAYLALGKLMTRDAEEIEYTLMADGKTNRSSSSVAEADGRPGTPEFGLGDYVDEQDLKKWPQPLQYSTPRVFMIESDGCGSEFMTEEQLAFYRHKIVENQHFEYHEPIKSMANSESVAWFEVKEKDRSYENSSPLTVYDIPSNDLDVELTTRLDKPSTAIYRYRNVLLHRPLEGAIKSEFEQTINDYKAWKAHQEKDGTEMGCQSHRSFDEKKQSFDRYMNILKRRQNIVNIESNHRRRDRLCRKFMDDLKAKLMEQNQTNGQEKQVKTPIRPGRDEFSMFNTVGLKSLQRASGKQGPGGDLGDHQRGGDQVVAGHRKAPSSHGPRGARSTGFRSMDMGYATSRRGFFVGNFFESKEGTEYLKENPPTERQVKKEDLLSSKMGTRESFKSLGNATGGFEGSMRNSQELRASGTAGVENEGDMEQSAHASGEEFHLQGEASGGGSGQDNPIVLLEAEDKDGDDRMASVSKTLGKKVEVTPSYYRQEMEMKKQRDEYENHKSEEYVYMKSKYASVTGGDRDALPTVNSIRKTYPKQELNEKYITQEYSTESRIKTSSMAARTHVKAPSVQTMRTQGQHQMLEKALSTKQTYFQMVETQNTMINAAVGDPLKRTLQIVPSSVRFGPVKVGSVFTISVMVKNEDSLAQRISIRQPKSKTVKVNYQPGMIAAGIHKKLEIELIATEENIGKLEDEFTIATKIDIFKIPVFANIMSGDSYDKLEEEMMQLHGRSAMKTIVHLKRELSRKAETPKIDQDEEFVYSTTSDRVLPKIPANMDYISLEPTKTITEVKKGAEGTGGKTGEKNTSFNSSQMNSGTMNFSSQIPELFDGLNLNRLVFP